MRNRKATERTLIHDELFEFLFVFNNDFPAAFEPD